MAPRILWLYLIFWSTPTFAQWNDNFADGNHNSNQVWSGDTAKFTVNPAFELQLNAPAETGNAFITTSTTIAHKTSWSFKIRMEFNPSSGNYARVYLMSDKKELDTPLNGYYLRIGHTNDDLCLYRQEGTTETLIADGRDKMFNTAEVYSTIKVTRDEHWNWQILCDTTGGEDYQVAALCKDSVILRTEYFGVRCFYTSTRSKKIFFDDFLVAGETYTDGARPRIGSFKIVDEKQALIGFSEPIDSATALSESNYQLSNNMVDSIIWSPQNPTQVKISFSNRFECSNNNALAIKNIQDTWKLPMNDTLISFTYCTPSLNDLIFSEIMADPSPTVGLPNAEYIEIYNRTKNAFDITNFNLQIGTFNYTFPEMNVAPESYLLVTSKGNQSQLSQFGTCLGLFSSSTALNNTGTSLQLKNPKGALISHLTYEETWHDDEFKAQGGWSLEQIDPWNPCGGKLNWTASKASAGGTPGKVNSVYSNNPDLNPPLVTSINVAGPASIEVFFSEPLDSASSLNSKNYEIVPDIGHPVKATSIGPLYSTIILELGTELKPGKIYTLKTSGTITDCAGNHNPQITETPLALSVRPDSGDIIINEVLFNAKTGSSEYIELYNRSSKITSTRNLLIGNKINNKTENLCRIKETGSLLFPGQYLLVAADIEKLSAFYTLKTDKNLVSAPCFPSLNDISASIVLLNDTFGMVDEFTYSEKMHLATLRNTEGVSLERVNPEKPAMFPGNWHSAAETAGYGTPGYRNSQYLYDSIANAAIEISIEVFSPDNDGYNDILSVNYNFTKTGCRAQVSIFDATGKLVRKLLNNELLGTSGAFNWDGTNDAQKMCTVGMYVIFIRAVFYDGTITEYKKTCVLAIKR